jgi:hypothetical protein
MTAANVEVVRTALDSYNTRDPEHLCDGIRRWLREADDGFDDARLDVGEISEIDSNVLVLGRFVVDGDEPGDDRSCEFGLVCACSDGRILHWTPYARHDAAILAAEMLDC